MKQASDTHPRLWRRLPRGDHADRRRRHGPFWRAPVEDAWATLTSLARHLTPHWWRAERFCPLVTSIVTSGSWRCLVYVLGPGCRLPEFGVHHGLGQISARPGQHSSVVHHHLQHLLPLQQPVCVWPSVMGREGAHPPQVGHSQATWMRWSWCTLCA